MLSHSRNSRIPQNTLPSPRIGTSHGGLRNFTFDHSRIPPIETSHGGLCVWTVEWRLPLYPPRIPSLQCCNNKQTEIICFLMCWLNHFRIMMFNIVLYHSDFIISERKMDVTWMFSMRTFHVVSSQIESDEVGLQMLNLMSQLCDM